MLSDRCQAPANSVQRWTFYLGTHEVPWLSSGAAPLFISHHRLRRYKRLPRAAERWALDSGGYTELRPHGRWQTSLEEYVAATERYSEEVGRLEWAASMDWICEPAIVRRTGLTVRAHQRKTVDNFLALRSIAPALPFAPILQGWTLRDYVHCVAMYEAAGINLQAEPIVGVGSIVGRQDSVEVADILLRLADLELRLHAFGAKGQGLTNFADAIMSADSTAWSLRARFDKPLPTCTHRRCNNCLPYALRWRSRLLDRLGLPSN